MEEKEKLAPLEAQVENLRALEQSDRRGYSSYIENILNLTNII
jgi:hypothetical protein